MNSLFLSRLVSLLWIGGLVVVFIVACDANPPAQTLLINDKLGHCLVFLVFGYSGQLIWRNKITNLKLLVFLAIYGGAIEIAQYYVPGRFFSVLDWLADILGLIVAALVFKLAHSK